jgi:hypothetical protein
VVVEERQQADRIVELGAGGVLPGAGALSTTSNCPNAGVCPAHRLVMLGGDTDVTRSLPTHTRKPRSEHCPVPTPPGRQGTLRRMLTSANAQLSAQRVDVDARTTAKPCSAAPDRFQGMFPEPPLVRYVSCCDASVAHTRSSVFRWVASGLPGPAVVVGVSSIGGDLVMGTAIASFSDATTILWR